MMLKADLLTRTLDECVDVAMDAADASNSDCAALVGCLATQDQLEVAAFKRQCKQFQDVADRLRRWQSRFDGGDETQDDTAKRQLLADLRLLLTAVRVAAFDFALHGRDAGLTDTEIADELMKCARLDSRLRGNILPWLKADLGVTDTKAL
jgi:hypothetical protein